MASRRSRKNPGNNDKRGMADGAVQATGSRFETVYLAGSAPKEQNSAPSSRSFVSFLRSQDRLASRGSKF